MNLSLSAINVNTLNISTYKEGPCKTVEKLIAITNRGSDIIFMTDCRLGKGIDKIKKILLLGKKTSYDLYANSTRGERGVCVAISRNRDIEVISEIKDTRYENYMLLVCKIDGKQMVVGSVYGPNGNNREFYRDLIGQIEGLGLPTIIGGDFNTVLDERTGAENLDLEDRDHIPQRENGRILREWLEEGNYVEPFRKKYPNATAMSYKPFRSRRRVDNGWENVNYSKSKLDFFIMSESLFHEVTSVFYGERLSRHFDHVEAILKIGKGAKKRRQST